MELQVDLRGGGAVGAADHVELPVAERCPHRVEVVHRHPRPVLGRVAAVPGSNARCRAGRRARCRDTCSARPAAGSGRPPARWRQLPVRRRDRRPRPSGPASRTQAGRRRGARSCARPASPGSPGRRRCRSGRRSPAPRTAPAATSTAPGPRRTVGRCRRDAGGGHQADQKPHDPPMPPVNRSGGGCEPVDMGEPSRRTIPQLARCAVRGYIDLRLYFARAAETFPSTGQPRSLSSTDRAGAWLARARAAERSQRRCGLAAAGLPGAADVQHPAPCDALRDERRS